MICSKELVIELIKMLSAVPALWNIKCIEYRNRNRKYDKMSKIASHFKTNVDDQIVRKIKSLKIQLSRKREQVQCRKTIFGLDSL